MESYVDKIGALRPKHFKHKDLDDIKDTVLSELNTHTENLSTWQEERRRRAENQDDPGEGGDDPGQSKGLFTKENVIFAFVFIKYTITGLVVPIVDMGSDLVTAVTHYVFGDFAWGTLTLLFIWVPGLVVGLAITIRGLRDKFSIQRLVNYLIFLVGFPIVYPIVQVLVNCYMLYLMIVNRSREIVRIMGHDVKQFKSLEGFLESAPQFVLQSYILLRGEKGSLEDLEDAEEARILILVASVIISFLSLTKTGFNVNVPDPDDNRKSKQYPQNSRYFWLSSILFHLVCVLFRVSCIAYFFAVFRAWSTIIIVAAVAINIVILYFVGASYTIALILGTVSIFMPNGYLLYNFAATFPVDFTFENTKRFLIWHMLTVTPIFLIGIITIIISAAQDASWFVHRVDETLLSNPEIQISLDVILIILGVGSLLICVWHWRWSILPLYNTPQEPDKEMEERAAEEPLETQEIS